MVQEALYQNGIAGTISSLPRLRREIEPLHRLRAVVLLAGTVRPSALSRSIGRSLLDLPVEEGRTVLELWREQVQSLAGTLELDALPMRIMIDQQSCEPRLDARSAAATTVERDPAAFRGTAGVLRDVCLDYDDDDVVLVGNAAQILVEPLKRLALDLSACGGDVSLLAHGDGTPAGLMLVRCGVLKSVRPVGFLDFKEQILPELAASGSEVRIVRRARATGIPVRTLDGYIVGLRAYHRLRTGRPALESPLQEDWRPTFALVEDRQNVGLSATIHDSVILAGGCVERNAVVVRSVVCPDGSVRTGATLADAIVARHRERNSRGSA